MRSEVARAKVPEVHCAAAVVHYTAVLPATGEVAAVYWTAGWKHVMRWAAVHSVHVNPSMHGFRTVKLESR